MNIKDLAQSTEKRREYCSDHNENCGTDCVGCERYDSELAAIANAVRVLEKQDLLQHIHRGGEMNYPECIACALLKEAQEVQNAK